MILGIVNAGGDHPVEVDLHPPAGGLPVCIGIYPRVPWTDDPSRSGIAQVDEVSGERYMLEQHLVSVSALVDDFLMSPSSVRSDDREALAQVFAECAARLRLSVVSEADKAMNQ